MPLYGKQLDDDAYCPTTEWSYPGEVPVIDQMPLYGGGSQDRPEQSKDTVELGRFSGIGHDWQSADLPR